MAKKQSSKTPPRAKPGKGRPPKAEKAPPENTKIEPLDPPPPGSGGTSTGDESQAT